jgi:hypothetical protein
MTRRAVRSLVLTRWVFWSNINETGRADSIPSHYYWAFDSESAVGNDALSSVDVY